MNPSVTVVGDSAVGKKILVLGFSDMDKSSQMTDIESRALKNMLRFENTPRMPKTLNELLSAEPVYGDTYPLFQNKSMATYLYKQIIDQDDQCYACHSIHKTKGCKICEIDGRKELAMDQHLFGALLDLARTLEEKHGYLTLAQLKEKCYDISYLYKQNPIFETQIEKVHNIVVGEHFHEKFMEKKYGPRP